ncbi:MAG: MFS transporter [Burkholderiales bacterium]|uniref:MFS transporter n=1 Tax=Ottowia sp. TaxID=1898956 RepID=UPI001AC1425F|nr:MFS transporter [Ottowia sp.]MBN9404643.1 MFS transporter [Burkholderiales bacterium]MBS0404321.1 MFS transporter [Pseudomonadota bacterium]MBS0415308.1 MFS transporter [Pseudomonadota bacterium]
MAEPVYLKRPPDWEEHEKPALPGSPAMPYHAPWERACYVLVAVLVGITGGMGNALFTVNMPTIQGQLGLTPSEAAWLSGAYVLFNMTANILIYKFRQQFGMRLFSEISLGIYATLCLLHLVVGSAHSLLWLRAASGLAAAACTSLGTLYMLQGMPRPYVLKMLVLGVGVTQLAAPLAWLLSPSLLNHGQWHNLYFLEAGLALMSFAAVVLLKLPTGVHVKAFEKLDFLTMALLVPGVGLLVAVLVQGTTRWWFNAPELAWMLVGAIVLLFAGLYLEHHRANPLFQTRWFTESATIRFVIGAIVLRFLTTEQSYGVVGMLRTLGMTPDQMQPLFVVIFAGTLAGIVLSAATFGMENLRKQLVAAIVLLGAAAFMDFGRTSLDRPADFELSQFLLAMGSGVFMGPLMLTGVRQGLKNGPNHMITAILTLSMTQAFGGLLGSALLGTYQIEREQAHSVALVQQINPADPMVAQRLQLQQQALAGTITDPALRAAQGAAQLSQIVRREANVLAFNDVFHLVALVALAHLAWALLLVGQARRAAALEAARTGHNLVQAAQEGGADAAMPADDIAGPPRDDAPTADEAPAAPPDAPPPRGVGSLATP